MNTIRKTTTTEITVPGIRIAAHDENGIECGRVYLYLMTNGLHEAPFGLAEDLFVEASHRKQGIGTILIEKLIEEAKNRGCYKLLATSRHGREHLHLWYQKFGFKDWGKEFRLDF